MTNQELVDMLSNYPLEAEVFIFDAEVECLAPVTGCITGPDPNITLVKGKYTIQLCSDDPEG